MKRTIVPLLAAVLFATPASAEIVVRNFDLSIGIGSPSPRYQPRREVVYVDRKPDVVVVRDHDHGRSRWERDRDRSERRHDRGHGRDKWNDRRRDDTRVVVVDRGHRCDEGGKTVVIADGRRR